MTSYNISINKELASLVEKEIKAKKYSNRSEFFRSVLRDRYIKEDYYTIEELLPNDPDYKLLQSRKKNAEFIPLTEFINETKSISHHNIKKGNKRSGKYSSC